LICIRENGGVVSELDVGNVIAKVQWCCRAIIYDEMLRKMERREKKAWKELGKYVRRGGRYTAFNSLRQLVMHLAQRATAGRVTG
jgi:hypothetical protein